MFIQPWDNRRRAWAGSLSLSIAIHCAMVLAFLVGRPAPTILTPSAILGGRGGSSTTPLYLPSHTTQFAANSQMATTEPLRLPRASRKALRQQLTPKALGPISHSADTPAVAESTRAGSPLGSLLEGPAEGHEVRIALPIYGPQPAVSDSDLPSGVEGNVIVEVTIDDKGNVSETKVLQSIGYGIDEKVLQALRNWHFSPATQDGIAVASKQDVHFHFGHGSRS